MLEKGLGERHPLAWKNMVVALAVLSVFHDHLRSERHRRVPTGQEHHLSCGMVDEPGGYWKGERAIEYLSI